MTVLGNSTKSINFTPSAPSLKDELRTGKRSFKDLAVDTVTELVQFQPRNVKQSSHFKSTLSASSKISSDAFLTVHELAYMIPGFVWSITTFPDLSITCGHPFFLDTVQNASVHHLSYDTTFNLSNFYLSVLVAQLDAFTERPCLPVAFLIHERKFEATHSLLLSSINAKPSAKFTPVIVTDSEASVIKALNKVLPHWKVVSCWNHILTDIEVWLKQRHSNAQKIGIYKSTVRELLTCQSHDEYVRKYKAASGGWAKAFKDYFDSHLTNRVMTACAGYLHSVNYTGDSVTNNISESFNNILKQHLDWTEVTVDRIVLTLHQLQVFYKSQILKSLQGFGPYTQDLATHFGLYVYRFKSNSAFHPSGVGT